MRKKEGGSLLRIGELARASGVTVSTVKYYIQQGFIEPELKTSANMAYYNPDNVNRIRLIKKLQKEFFYPLNLIGEILRGSKDDLEINLLSAVYRLLPPKEGKTLTLENAAEETGLTHEQAQMLAGHGVVKPVTVNGKPMLDVYDIGILRLVKRRCDAGLPFLQTLESLAIYSKAMDEVVRKDVDVMIRRTVMTGSFSSSELASMVREADTTLDKFVPLKRAQLDSHYSSKRMHELLDFLAELDALTRWLPDIEDGGVISKQAADCLDKLGRLVEEADVAASGSALSQAREFFSEMDTGMEPDPEKRRSLLAIRLGFFALSPEMFGWQEQARAYMEGFEAECAGFLGREEAAAFSGQVINKVKVLSGGAETCCVSKIIKERKPVDD